MMKSKKIAIDLSGGAQVVATLHSKADFAPARRLSPGEIDFIELRVDAFAADPEPLRRFAEKSRVPLIVTVRDAREGGLQVIPSKKRAELFELFLPHAIAIDVELRSAEKLAGVLEEAKASGVAVILSHHDFNRTPSQTRLQDLAQTAATAGADLFKVATTANHPREFAILLEFLTRENSLPRSVMAMGAFGKISRLVFATCGSVLNYGFLSAANASGQWPAKLLKARIAEVEASAIRSAT